MNTNNNGKKLSPMDEIMQVTRRAVNPNQTPEVPAPKTEAVQPRRVAPPAPSTTVEKAPVKEKNVADYGIEVPDLPPRNRAASSTTYAASSVSRAEQVRVARSNAAGTRSEAEHTRVMQATPAPSDKEMREREEAARIVSANKRAANSQTRLTDTVPSVSARSYEESKKTKANKNGSVGNQAQEVGTRVLSGTVKAIIYIVSVLVISVCLSLFIIFVGNDCFAFVKTDVDVTVSIDEGGNLSDIADVLHDNGVIKYPGFFKMYVRLRNKDVDDYLSGNRVVNPTMSYDTLIAAFKPSSAREEVSVTFIEGSTTDEMIEKLVSVGIGTKEGYKKAINEGEYDFWFVERLDAVDGIEDRKYRLDGYLFPDTYNFYTDSTEEEVIYKLLENFNAKFDEANSDRAMQLDMTVDDIVILASIIQKEAMYITDYPLVSSVFHNRLNSRETNGMLQSNATVQYTMPKEEVTIELSTEQINKYDNAYNTFLYEGLPVGPICNSSLNALNWALYPNDTDYYYFVSDAQGYNLYAQTYSEHLANIAKAAEE